MPNVHIHIDQKLYRQVLRAADKERLSVPDWIINQIRFTFKPDEMNDFCRCFGSLHDIDHDYHYPELDKDEIQL